MAGCMAESWELHNVSLSIYIFEWCGVCCARAHWKSFTLKTPKPSNCDGGCSRSKFGDYGRMRDTKALPVCLCVSENRAQMCEQHYDNNNSTRQLHTIFSPTFSTGAAFLSVVCVCVFVGAESVSFMSLSSQIPMITVAVTKCIWRATASQIHWPFSNMKISRMTKNLVESKYLHGIESNNREWWESEIEKENVKSLWGEKYGEFRT